MQVSLETPPLVLGLSLLWRSTRPWIAGSLTVVAALLLYDCWPQLAKKFSMVYLLQECGMYGLLAFGFGRSLGSADTALCTRLADRLHDDRRIPGNVLAEIFRQQAAAGVVIVADGSEDARGKLERVLWNDPATGVMRHADAGYEIAIESAHQNHLNLPSIG